MSVAGSLLRVRSAAPRQRKAALSGFIRNRRVSASAFNPETLEISVTVHNGTGDERRGGAKLWPNGCIYIYTTYNNTYRIQHKAACINRISITPRIRVHVGLLSLLLFTAYCVYKRCYGHTRRCARYTARAPKPAYVKSRAPAGSERNLPCIMSRSCDPAASPSPRAERTNNKPTTLADRRPRRLSRSHVIVVYTFRPGMLPISSRSVQKRV